MPKDHIKAIHCRNFRGFKQRKIEGLDPGLNIFIGDNDTGKSSILLAIELVLGANPGRVEAIGLDKLLNQGVVDEFLAKSDRTFADLPEMQIDLYLNGEGREEFDGQHNIARVEAHGLYLRCRPREELIKEINEIVSKNDIAFPYEYYMVEIKGFSGETITPYRKPLACLAIDNTKISSELASRAYIKTIYHANTSDTEKHSLKYAYREAKDLYAKNNFSIINARMEGDYGFSVRNNVKANLETDLTICRSGVDIDNLGMGQQCFIRTEFALAKRTNIDIVLLEEPENHLSHPNMKRLINVIKDASQSQVFVATHSSLVCSRLDLRHAILFGPIDRDPIKLDALPPSTAEFFMKAPDSSVLEFALSDRAVLVEGDAEYILMEAFFTAETGNGLSGSGISVISIGGISFPRYLDIAKLLGKKVAVITDNDGDPESTCVNRYSVFEGSDNIKVFYDSDKDRRTFEVCVYRDNQVLCDGLFSEGRRAKDADGGRIYAQKQVRCRLRTGLKEGDRDEGPVIHS